jgi:hypothetical protein
MSPPYDSHGDLIALAAKHQFGCPKGACGDHRKRVHLWMFVCAG